MSDTLEQPKKRGFFHDSFAKIYEEEHAKRKPANFGPEDLKRRLKNLEERQGQPIDVIINRIAKEDEMNPLLQWLNETAPVVSTEEHNVGEAIGRIREFAEEHDIPEERTKKIIAAEVSQEDTTPEDGNPTGKSFKDIYPPFVMPTPKQNADFQSPTARFLNRCEDDSAV